MISFVRQISHRDEGLCIGGSAEPLLSLEPGLCNPTSSVGLSGPVMGLLHFDNSFYHSPLCGKASGDACYECSVFPIITLEVSRTSQHLGWYWRVGSGTQACTQVLLAAAAVGFTSMQLRGRARSFLGAKETSPSWRWDGVQGQREMSLSGWLVWMKDNIFGVSPTSGLQYAYLFIEFVLCGRQTQFLYMLCFVLYRLILVMYDGVAT